MTLSQIENLSVQELKLFEAFSEIEKEPDLAKRYVQARTDAKIRDEKLSEQGKEITKLKEDIAGLALNVHALQDEKNCLNDEIHRLEEISTRLNLEGRAEKTSLRSEISSLASTLKSEVEAKEKAISLAKGRRTVLAGLINQIAPLLVSEE